MLVIGVLAGGGLASWRVVRRAQAHRLTTQARIDGLAAFQEGDYETVLSKLGFYLRGQGDDVEVLLAFADSRAKVPTQGTKHLVESARFYTAVLRLEPDNQEGMQRLLDLHRRLGMRTEWISIADRILALDPNHVEALAAKAAGLRLEGDMDGALRSLGRLVEIEPGNIKWRTSILGIRLARNDPDDQLIEQCDAWIDTDAGDGRLFIVKARLLASLGRIEPARAAARLAAGSRSKISKPLPHIGVGVLMASLLVAGLTLFNGAFDAIQGQAISVWAFVGAESRLADVTSGGGWISGAVPLVLWAAFVMYVGVKALTLLSVDRHSVLWTFGLVLAVLAALALSATYQPLIWLTSAVVVGRSSRMRRLSAFRARLDA